MKEFIARLTWVDYLTLIAVLRGCYVGYRSGFFPELLRIAAYIITVLVTLRFYDPLGQFLTLKTFLNATTATALAFFALLAGTFALATGLMRVVLWMLKIGEGGFVYRVIGMLIGACRWLVLLSMIFLLIGYTPLETLKTDIRSRSVVGPKVAQVAPTIFDFLATLSPQLGLPDRNP